MTDMLNVPIVPGVTIAYPGRKRSKLWQSTMRVLSIEDGRIHGLLPHGRAATIRKLDGVVVTAGGVL